MILSKEKILDKLWAGEGNYVADNTLAVYVRRMRMEIETAPGNPQMLLIVRGMGYQWNIGN
ncbi:helix-turn-helix domain-containing protein [Lacrimispora sp.]|uniref:winged helix-turn-helix domain-containing protein n=1 Tax=Lacrimispora sp. TaxID=2719234 RepID=UPI0034617360